MAGVISEVRAKFGATASGFLDTIRQLRSGVSSFANDTEQSMHSASDSIRTLDGSARGIQTTLRTMGRAGQLDGLTGALRHTQEELRSTGQVGTVSAQELERAIAQARHEISQMGGASEQHLGQLEAAIQSAERELVSLGHNNALNDLVDNLGQAANGAQDMQGSTVQAFTQAESYANRAAKATKSFRTTFLSWTAAAVGLGTITAGFGGLIMVNEQYTQALNQVTSATGATAEEQKALGQSMQDIYANNYGADFQDIAQSLGDVQKATGLVGDALEIATESAISLRDTFGYEVVESSAVASTMMKNFGITADEAFELVAQGAQEGLDKNGDMMDSFNEYSVYFKTLGFDAEGMWNVFKAGSDAGAFNMDKVGDAVKELGIRVKDGSKSSQEGFAALGLNADDMAAKFAKGGDSAQTALQTVFKKLGEIKDPIKQNAAGVALFGTQFEDLEAKTIIALGTVQDEANKTGTAMDTIKQVKYNSVTEAIQGIGRQLVVGLINPMQDKVMPVINRMINAFTQNMPAIKTAVNGAFNTLADVFTALEPTFTNIFGILKDLAPVVLVPLGLAFKGLTTVIAPIVNYVTDLVKSFTGLSGFAPILAGIVTGFVVYQTTLKMVMAAQKAWSILSRAHIILMNGFRAAVLLFNAAWAANPIGLVIAILAGLGVALYMAYQKSETFRNIVNGVWAAIKDGFGAAINWITTTLPTWWNNIMSFFSNIWTWVKGFFSKWGVEILAVVAPFIGIPLLIAKHWDAIKAFFSGLWTSVSGAVMGFVNSVVSWFTNLGNQIGSTMSGLWSKITGLWNQLLAWFVGIGQSIGSAVSSMWSVVTGYFMNFINNIKFIFSPLINFFKQTWENIKLAVLGVVGIITSAIVGDFEGVKLGLLAIWTAIKRQLQNVWDTLKEIAIRAFTVLKNGIITIMNGVKSGITSAWNAIKSAVSATVSAIKTAAVNGWNALKSGVINAMNAVKSGISSAWSAIKSAVSSAVSSIKSTAVSAWNGIKSGVMSAMDSIRSGISSAWSAVKSAVSSAISTVKSTVSSGFSSAKNAASSAMSGLKNAVSSGISAVKNFFSDMKSDVVSKVKGINLRTIGADIIRGLVGGLGSMLGSLKNKAKEIADTVKNAIKDKLKIKSPSRVMKEMGINTGEGLEIGMDSMIGNIAKTAKNMAGAVTDNMNMETALGGALNTSAQVNKMSTIRHLIDLANIPSHIDQTSLENMLVKALGKPRVQTAVDRTNQVVFNRTVRPQGG